jgi:hypothetical protein
MTDTLNLRLRRLELLLFIAIMVLNVIPFISLKIFPSLDGASHLANANVIRHLLFSNNTFLPQFFSINPEPVPNWTGHAFLALLMTIMPAWIAEKIMIALMLILMPFAFRRLIQTLSPGIPWLSYLIFPFTHSMFLIYGFYNFNISIILFLFTLNFFLRRKDRWVRFSNLLILGLLLALTYFSHILTFGLLGISLLLWIIVSACNASMDDPEQRKRIVWGRILKQSALLMLSAIIPLALSAWFFTVRSSSGEIAYLPESELFSKWIHLKPLRSMDGIAESKSIRFLAWLFISLILFVMIRMQFLNTFHSRKHLNHEAGIPKAENTIYSFWFFIVFFGFLLLYMVAPDSFGSGSYISDRICFIALLILILWLSAMRIPVWILILAAMIGVGVNFKHVTVLKEKLTFHHPLALACSNASKKIPGNVQVLPVNMLHHFFTGHFADYLATDKPVVMVYNYECSFGYFPLVWNKEKRPNYFIGDSLRPKDLYIPFELEKGRPFRKVDYIFLLGTYDTTGQPFFITLDRILKEDATLVYQADSCQLFRIGR